MNSILIKIIVSSLLGVCIAIVYHYLGEGTALGIIGAWVILKDYNN